MPDRRQWTWMRASAAAVVLAAGLWPASAGQAAGSGRQPDPFLAEIARLGRSVAPVICRSSSTERPVDRTLGTVFFVSASGEFITADHILTAAGTCPKAVYLPVNGWSPQPDAELRLFNFTRCLRDGVTDIAVCRTERDLRTAADLGVAVPPVVLDTAEPLDGTAVAFTGFPLEIKYPLTARGYVAASQPAFMAGGVRRLVLDRFAWPGSSGGPVFLSDGRVVGMVVERGIDRSSGLAFARPASLIVEALARFRQENPALP